MKVLKPTLIVASLGAATGLFWAKVLIVPPISEAAIASSIPVEQLTLNASKDLRDFDADFQRHIGVLDTLKVP